MSLIVDRSLQASSRHLQTSESLLFAQHGHHATLANHRDHAERQFDEDQSQGDAGEEDLQTLHVGLKSEEEDEAQHADQLSENEEHEQAAGQEQIAFHAEELSHVVVEDNDEEHRQLLAEGRTGVRQVIPFEDEAENLQHEPTESVVDVHVEENVKNGAGRIRAREHHRCRE